MTKIRKEVRDQIIQILKREMNRTEALQNYSQWVMGVSIRENGKISKETRDTQETSYTARIIIKTNQSPYLDGMDIIFTESRDSKKDNRVDIDPYYYENTPELQGSEVKDAIEWIERNGYIVYLQEQDPYREFLYIERLKDIIGEYSFETLDEYHFDRSNGRSSILEVYKDLLQETRRSYGARQLSC